MSTSRKAPPRKVRNPVVPETALDLINKRLDQIELDLEVLFAELSGDGTPPEHSGRPEVTE